MKNEEFTKIGYALVDVLAEAQDDDDDNRALVSKGALLLAMLAGDSTDPRVVKAKTVALILADITSKDTDDDRQAQALAEEAVDLMTDLLPIPGDLDDKLLDSIDGETLLRGVEAIKRIKGFFDK